MDALQLFAMKLATTECKPLVYALDMDFVERCQAYVVAIMEGDVLVEWPSDDPPYGDEGQDADDDADSGVEDAQERRTLLRKQRVLQSFLRVTSTAMTPTAATPVLDYFNNPVCRMATAC